MYKNFKVGDRVIASYGETGVVASNVGREMYSPDAVWVKWDSDCKILWTSGANLSLIESSQEKVKIDMNKRYRTVGGNDVRILCVDSPNESGAVVYMIEETGDVYRADEFGKSYNRGHTYDLVEYDPLSELKIDDKVMVRSIGEPNTWYPRHFAGVSEEGYIKVWDAGKTSWTANDEYDFSVWDEWRLPTKEDLGD